MEIKIQCDCGQKFKFDVEPVGGRMPWEVNCPVCGAVGTEKANQAIAQQVAAAPTIPVARVLTPSPTAAAIPTAAPIASPEPPKARLSISRPQPTSPPEAPPVPAAPMPRAVPRAVTTVRAARRAAEEAERKDANFWLSVVAVLIGAILGMTLWHLGYRLTGWRLGIMALVTGCAAGAAPQVLGHYRGVAMGFIAAFVTFVAIFTTQFLNAKVEVKEYVEDSATEEYEDAVEEAKRALAAVPNGTDQEIRTYLAKEQSFESFVIKPAEIEDYEVRSLRGRLPFMKELAAGQISPGDYSKREEQEQQREEYEEELTEAKAVVATAPNGTDQELRIYMVKQYKQWGLTVNPAEVDADDLADLKERYPKMRQMVEGSLTQEQHAQQRSEEEIPFDEDDFLNFYVIFQTIGIFNIINIVLGIGAAFLTAKG